MNIEDPASIGNLARSLATLSIASDAVFNILHKKNGYEGELFNQARIIDDLIDDLIESMTEEIREMTIDAITD